MKVETQIRVSGVVAEYYLFSKKHVLPIKFSRNITYRIYISETDSILVYLGNHASVSQN